MKGHTAREANRDALRISGHKGNLLTASISPYQDATTPFLAVLRKILQGNHAEIARLAREINVSENTIHRWIHGTSDPRAVHLRCIPEVLPAYRGLLVDAINQTFPSLLETPLMAHYEVKKEIYCRVLEIAALDADADSRFWQVSLAIFEDELRLLDVDGQGVAIMYAQLTPPRDTGIHALREVMMRGTPPWPATLDCSAYFGSVALAGAAVSLQHTQIWDSSDEVHRSQIAVGFFEQSACAVPIMRGNLLAGALVVSSTQSGFFHNALACQAVAEYGLMMGVALSEEDYYHFSLLHLRPMPNVTRQRDYIASSYRNRVLDYVRTYAISRREAEIVVQREFELEMEEWGYRELEQAYNQKIGS
jgi:hypothetical protein